jgi:hypothetical protein
MSFLMTKTDMLVQARSRVSGLASSQIYRALPTCRVSIPFASHSLLPCVCLGTIAVLPILYLHSEQLVQFPSLMLQVLQMRGLHISCKFFLHVFVDMCCVVLMSPGEILISQVYGV